MLVILCAFGLSGIALIGKMTMSNNIYNDYDPKQDYQDNINWLNETKGTGYEQEVAMWQYLIDNDIDSDDWRYDVLMNAYSDESPTVEFYTIKEYLDNNDWKGYCQHMLDTGNITEGEKWEYQYRIDNDISFDKSNEKKNDLIMTIADAKSTIARMGDAKTDGENSRAALEDKITLAQYQLDNNKLDNTADQTSLFDTDSPDQITFWPIFLTGISCDSCGSARYRHRRRNSLLRIFTGHDKVFAHKPC